MMNPELKARWVAALRSGEYKQGEGMLCKNGSYCCLGVLEDITKEEMFTEVIVIEEPDDFDEDVPVDKIIKFDGEYELPSKEHNRAFFGDKLVPFLVINGVQKKLHDHNDSGESFLTIAKAIEEQL